MAKEEAQEQKNKQHSRAELNTNGVIITVYVESWTVRSHQRYDPLKRIKPNPFPKKPPLTSRTRGGYDRRAQLLAYARELREANKPQLDWPQKTSMPNSKKWRWPTPPVRLQALFGHTFRRTERRRWGYDRIESKENAGIDQSCGPKCINWRKAKATKRSDSQFCRRLKRMLKGLRACQCNKG